MGTLTLVISLLNDVFNSVRNIGLPPWLSFVLTLLFSLNSGYALLVMTISPVLLIISIYITCIDNIYTIFKYIYDVQNPANKIYNITDIVVSQSAFMCCISPFAIIALNGISRYAIQVLYFYDIPTIQINQYVADNIISLDWILNPRFLFMTLLLVCLYIALITIQKITYYVNQFIMYTMILSVAPLLRMSIDIYNIQNNSSSLFTSEEIIERITSGKSVSNIEAILNTLCPSQDTAVYEAMDDLQESILRIAQNVVTGSKNSMLSIENLKYKLNEDSTAKENLSKKLAQLDIAKLRYPKISIYSDAIADEINIIRSSIR